MYKCSILHKEVYIEPHYNSGVLGSFLIIIRNHVITCPFMANVTQSEP